MFTAPLSPTIDSAAAFAHRTTDRDTFIRSWQAAGAGRHFASARLPHDHPFFPPSRDGRPDPLLLAESFRQAGLVILHAGHDVPLDHVFLLGSLQYDYSMPVPDAQGGPCELTLEV
ncbi:adhesin, partial [Streptomyces sp. SID5785]